MAIGQLVSSSSTFLQAGVGDSAAVEASACVSAALDAAREAGRGDVSALRAACALVDFEGNCEGSSRDVCAALDLAMASRDSAAATLLCAKQATLAAQRLEFSLEQRQRRQMPTENEDSDSDSEEDEEKPEKPPPPPTPPPEEEAPPPPPSRTFEDLRRDAQTLLARLEVDIEDLRSQVLCRANPEPKHVRALEAWVAAALDRTLLDLRKRLRGLSGDDVTAAVHLATAWLLGAAVGLTPTQALDARAFAVSCALSPATPRALVSALRDRLCAAAGAVECVDSRCDEVMRHIDDVAAQHELRKARHSAQDD
jgi:hypothetical protein